jgi:hypothetical protein
MVKSADGLKVYNCLKYLLVSYRMLFIVTYTFWQELDYPSLGLPIMDKH